jgi:hypothetical protein
MMLLLAWCNNENQRVRVRQQRQQAARAKEKGVEIFLGTHDGKLLLSGNRE